MLLRLILLFTVVPLAELALLMWISRYVTIPGTIGIVLVTGITGAALARHQGWRTWGRIRDELRAGQVPGDALLDGLMILVAGALLITPGVMTDAVGFALLVAPVRGVLKRKLRERFRARTVVQVQRWEAAGGYSHPEGGGEENVIDADFTRKNDETPGDRGEAERGKRQV